MQTESFFPIGGRWRLLILAAMFLVSLAIRVYDGTQEPYLRFDVRQYYSANIARGYYYQVVDIDPELRAAAETTLSRQPPNEPHIMELLATGVFRLVGADPLWLPGVIATLFFLIGGVFVYLIVENLDNGDASIVATGFYLFLPMGIVQGNNFQPDSLMLMGILTATYVLLLYARKPSWRTLLIAAVAAGVTIFAKLQSAFIIGAVFLAMSIYAHGWRLFLLRTETYVFGAIAVLPALLYLYFGLATQGTLDENSGGRIVPSLLLEARYWRGWLRQINNTVSFAPLVVALVGVGVSGGLRRHLLMGMWGGYILLGLLFTWNIHTHLYYHLPLIPIVAISLAQIGGAMLRYVSDRVNQAKFSLTRRYFTYSVLVAALLLTTLLVVAQGEQEVDDPDYARKVEAAVEIGDLLDHNTATYHMAHGFGLPLMYHGGLSGEPWFTRADADMLDWRDMDGLIVDLDSPAAIEEHLLNNPKLPNPEFFVITDMTEWAKQDALREYLDARYPVFAETDDYIIYDLRAPLT